MRRRWKVTARTATLALMVGGASAVAAAFLARAQAVQTIPPSDSGLQKALAQLNAASPEEVARLEGKLAKSTSTLPSGTEFDAWMRGWSGNWTVETRSAEIADPIERRRYVVAYDDPNLRVWPDMVSSLKALCSEPGVTIDRVDLALGPDGNRFKAAEIAFTARIRR